MEVMFTSVDSIMAGDWRLMGRTSLLMFPIYGMGALLLPVNCLLDQWIAGIPGQERGRTVSYTHLDVYKRQGRNEGRGSGRCDLLWGSGG